MIYNVSSGEWYGGAGSVSYPYSFIESESPLPNSDGSGILARVLFDALGSASSTPDQYKVKIIYSAVGGCVADEIATNAYYMDELVYNTANSYWHETKTAACSASGSLTTDAINVFSISLTDELMYDDTGDTTVDFWFQGGDGSVEKSAGAELGANNQHSGIHSIVIYKKN